MTSHEYARALQQTVDHLLSRPEVEFPTSPYLFVSYWEKDKFVAAARAMGTGKKEFQADDLRFNPAGTCLTMSISRSKVCRKIQDAKWECEPLFSDEEIVAVGEPAEAAQELRAETEAEDRELVDRQFGGSSKP